LVAELEKKASFRKRKSQPVQDPAGEQPRPHVDETAAAAEKLRAKAGEMQAALDQSGTSPDKAKAA
jgi:hypothetical protein